MLLHFEPIEPLMEPRKRTTTRHDALSALLIMQSHRVAPISDGMLRPIKKLIAALSPGVDLLVVGDGGTTTPPSKLSETVLPAPTPLKNTAMDFVVTLLGRKRKLKRQVASIAAAYPVTIVTLRASWVGLRGAVLLKSDLFSVNYRRRVQFARKHLPARLPKEILKLALSVVQELNERRIYSSILLHSALEQRMVQKARYLPIITEPIACVDASHEALANGRVLVVGYQFSDPIANADTDAILAAVLSQTNDASRIFYLGHKTKLLPESQQTEWVEDYQAFIRQFANAVYARSVCSGAHNKIIDLLQNGCVVYCVPMMKDAFATPCRYLVPLAEYKHNVGNGQFGIFSRYNFCEAVETFFSKEAEIYREVTLGIAKA